MVSVVSGVPPPSGWDQAWAILQSAANLLSLPVIMVVIGAGWKSWKNRRVNAASVQVEEFRYEVAMAQIASGAVKDMLEMLHKDRAECRELLRLAKLEIEGLKASVRQHGIHVPDPIIPDAFSPED